MLLVFGTVGVLVAACGSGSSPGVASIGSTTSTTTSAAASASPSPFQSPTKEYQYALSYAECMRSNGLPNFPDPTRSSHSLTFNSNADSRSPHFRAANSACKHLLPDDGGRPTAAQTAAEVAKLLKYSKCMRAHGVTDFPDPINKPDQIGFSLNGIDPNSPEFKAAAKACASLGLLGRG